MNPRIRLVIAGVVVVALAATAAYFILRGGPRGDGLVASGTVEATEAQLGFEVSGRIAAVVVREGDTVTQGQALAQLDTTEAATRRSQSQAQARAARARLLELERGSRPEEIDQARAAARAADQRRAEAERDFDRAKQLIETDAISRQAYDQATLALDLARAVQVQAAKQLELVEQGPRQEQIAAQRALLQQAEAAVRTFDAQISRMTIRAPFDGVVTARAREPGEIVSPGSAVMTVLNRNDRWVRIYVPETRIGAVRLQGRASISTDSYPGKSYPGDVESIASEAEFTPKTVQTREERVKLVYAVKVRITDDPDNQLKPGMPADVQLEADPR